MNRRYEIKPSVLARQPARFSELLKIARQLTPAVHIDCMDGLFTKQRSLGPAGLAQQLLSRQADIHLMVRQPTQWLTVIRQSGAGGVILHSEIADHELVRAYRKYRRLGLRIGIAYKLPSRMSRSGLPWQPDWVHLMLGPIGAYGSRMSPRAIARIRSARRLFPKARISCDVGINPETLPKVVSAGADCLVIGSYLTAARNYRQHWAELQAQLRQL